MSENKTDGFFGIVEIMGHKRYAGFIGEQVIGGASFVRVDVPKHGDCDAFSKLFGASAIYAITPCSEDAARIAAGRIKEQPLTEWDLPDHWRRAVSQGQLPFHDDEEDDSDN